MINLDFQSHYLNVKIPLENGKIPIGNARISYRKRKNSYRKRKTNSYRNGIIIGLLAVKPECLCNPVELQYCNCRLYHEVLIQPMAVWKAVI